MSTPSKKRRKAREWMEHEQNRLELKFREECGRRIKEERRKYEAVVTPDAEGTCTPLGRPEHLHYRVASVPGMRGRIFNPRDLLYYDRIDEYVFRVRQHAHRLPCGTTVVWYGLEFCS